MKNKLKVFYENDKGLYTFDNNKMVFQHREMREGVKIGLGIFDDSSIFDRGNYAFAVFKNVPTVIPDAYYTVSFFNNRGVPLKIERGYYGDNIFLRETYQDRTYIRAYEADGSVGLYESDNIKNDNYEGVNVYYTRIEKLIEKWEDITDSVISKVYDSIKDISCDIPLNNEIVSGALKGLSRNKIYQLSSGVIVADGKFESLIIWNEGHDVKMTWLGFKINLADFEYKDITDEINGLNTFEEN